MECYLCTYEPRPGSARFGIRAAVGICQRCGIGVCLGHSRKAGTAGSPLYCVDCALLVEAERDRSAGAES